MRHATLLQGSYVADIRTLEYWTRCENCRERKACEKRRAPAADCDRPGQIWFLVNGKRSVGWSGVITLKKIERTVHDYLEKEPPEDVAMPMVQMELEL